MITIVKLNSMYTINSKVLLISALDYIAILCRSNVCRLFLRFLPCQRGFFVTP
jgi:hypothetical protein